MPKSGGGSIGASNLVGSRRVPSPAERSGVSDAFAGRVFASVQDWKSALSWPAEWPPQVTATATQARMIQRLHADCNQRTPCLPTCKSPFHESVASTGCELQRSSVIGCTRRAFLSTSQHVFPQPMGTGPGICPGARAMPQRRMLRNDLKAVDWHAMASSTVHRSPGGVKLATLGRCAPPRPIRACVVKRDNLSCSATFGCVAGDPSPYQSICSSLHIFLPMISCASSFDTLRALRMPNCSCRISRRNPRGK